jgi:hypothetical protein
MNRTLADELKKKQVDVEFVVALCALSILR